MSRRCFCREKRLVFAGFRQQGESPGDLDGLPMGLRDSQKLANQAEAIALSQSWHPLSSFADCFGSCGPDAKNAALG
ncbi:hypothetical protein Poly41_31130 [Novipirellula artificiosorum]|uniref:Uncharacterized protein n=1 Tax=Novipirellula artificiosorum TaxID=2528016 RepID=A0A5C6DUC2_9BACT|nr:hypothetical protein Poly41_31130 [Novipirellula artificiosorum]